MRVNRKGHFSYLPGHKQEKADWRFFPVAFLFKTPLPFLALALFGMVFLFRRSWQRKDWRLAATTIAALVILLADSDLDWGQDLLRLGRELRARGIEDAYAWFENYEPVARVGRSILLYYFNEEIGLENPGHPR